MKKIENEVWKDIDGYEGIYQISNLGRVKNVTTNHIKTTFESNNGYLRVRLYKQDGGKNFSIHRLVAKSFISNPNCFKEVNHKDENVLNNTVQNLEWCSRTYNNNYGDRNRKVSEKLSIPIVRISQTGDISKYTSMHEASIKTGLSLSHICNLCSGRRKQGGYVWKRCLE